MAAEGEDSVRRISTRATIMSTMGRLSIGGAEEVKEKGKGKSKKRKAKDKEKDGRPDPSRTSTVSISLTGSSKSRLKVEQMKNMPTTTSLSSSSTSTSSSDASLRKSKEMIKPPKEEVTFFPPQKSKPKLLLGKKKKMEKKENIKEEEVVPVELNLSEIIRQELLKEQGFEEGVAVGVEKSVSKPKHVAKPPKKKAQPKLTAKELARLEEERRIREEEEAARFEAEEKQRKIDERKAAIAKEKADMIEQEMRVIQLADSKEQFEEMAAALVRANMIDKEKEEWEEYLACNGLPTPSIVGEMNTYLHLWKQKMDTVTPTEAQQRTDEVCGLLDKLQTLIDDPFGASIEKQKDWHWVLTMFRDYQAQHLQSLTYRLLGNITKRTRRVDIPTSEFRLKSENFCLCLFIMIQLPIPTPNPRTGSRGRITQEWPEMNVTVVFPVSIKCVCQALRCLYAKYDHLSDTCPSFKDPECPAPYQKELNVSNYEELLVKMHYKYDRKPKTKKEPIEVVQDDGTIILVEPEPDPIIPKDVMPPKVPYQKLDPTASEYYLHIESLAIEEARNKMKIEVPPNVLNLRKYVILGGIYSLDLYWQPTQPQGMVSFEIFVTPRILPCMLEEPEFHVDYTPPPPTAPGVRKDPEQIEAELLIQEKQLDELIFITLQLPQHVCWLEVPIVCHWNKEEKHWTTKDVFDYKYIEEKGYLTFRTGRFGPFALAMYRYANFPFQAWEIRPEPDGGVTLQITAAIIMIEFHVKKHLICVSQIQNLPNQAMESHIGVYYKLPKLRRILRECGIDLFPSHDTFFYVEGTCEKHWPMEMQTYYGMALASICYNFSWSRWNMPIGTRYLVFQMRVYRLNRPKQFDFQTVLVTPYNANVVDCTEVSPQFNDTPIEGMRFYADFFQLVKNHSNIAIKTKILDGPMEMAETLAQLCCALRFLSFS